MVAVLPNEMSAIGFDRPGEADVLRPQQLDVPRAGEGEVLIEVAYAGVNRPDVLQRMGLYPPPEGASPIPGLEVSGRVIDLGRGANQALLGQNVCALVTGGGYAQYCVADARACLPVSEAMPMAEAAAIPETLFTVWHNVFERGWASEGERILVHGGTSGIGTMAILLGKAFGLEVITTCGTDEKCEAARTIGADLAINYNTEDFAKVVRDKTAGRGVDIVLDMVSGGYVQRNLECLATNGRHITIAVLGGTSAEINMARVMLKRLTMTGSTLRARSRSFKALLAEEILSNAWPLFTSQRLRPVMDRIYPLADAPLAHQRMEAGAHIGKIVLET